MLIGGYFRQTLPLHDFSWFVQAVADLPLNSYHDYKPGNQLTATLGIRYDATDRLALMLQLNMLFKARDSGAEAEPENSGGQFYFVSPGAELRDHQERAALRVLSAGRLPVRERRAADGELGGGGRDHRAVLARSRAAAG